MKFLGIFTLMALIISCTAVKNSNSFAFHDAHGKEYSTLDGPLVIQNEFGLATSPRIVVIATSHVRYARLRSSVGDNVNTRC